MWHVLRRPEQHCHQFNLMWEVLRRHLCPKQRAVEDAILSQRPEEGTNYWNAQTHRRTMIYVHAKLMIGRYSLSFSPAWKAGLPYFLSIFLSRYESAHIPTSFTSLGCKMFSLCYSVDDEYIMIGSANLNQRSMDGARDTEIAQGCY